ncbi:hypothetical protein [Laribacter hongkongensis]|uniref:hypothetical protein n=1 Tax=Laribacter hongkongensis TaxID=168471 RepID=UPI001EFE67D1|nr:hypothetical protein [Laribacter hongkongensis]MCG9033146.1 hypothetical protein [Laribacter hongkongensis]MCG9093185.1 hypothetical protein [Laribacter hongkongensis]
MSAYVKNAGEAVNWVLDTMADSGQAIDSHQLAVALEKLLDRQWQGLSIHDIRTLAGAVAALNLAPPLLGPIARSSESTAREAMQNGEQTRELTIGGLIHGHQ